MNIRDLGTLRQTVGERLGRASYDPRKLVLLHAAVSLGVTLLIALLDLFLSQQIDGTGGLAGMQTRTILETVRSALQFGGSIALPFWEVGIIYAAICLARGQEARPNELLSGFRRFGPVLRLLLVQGMLYFAVAMVCANISSFIFMLTPLAQPLVEAMTPMLEDASILNSQMVMDEATAEVIMANSGPLLAIFCLLFLVAVVPLMLRFRLSEYLIMDGDPGAMHAMLTSWKLTKGNVFALLKVDLSFWWFYVLQLLCGVVGYANLLLPAVGVDLPLSDEAAYVVFFLAQILLQLALYWWAGSRVYTTYALAYDTLLQPVQVPPPPVSDKVPWDY